MQFKIRRSSPKRSKTKQALIAAGAFGVAAGTVKRILHRKPEEPAEH
jgi:hypothetical protein